MNVERLNWAAPEVRLQASLRRALCPAIHSVRVTVADGVLVLRGHVSDQHDQVLCGIVARLVPGSPTVRNQVAIVRP